MNSLPEFDSPFLTETAKSFSKVRKSIKYDSYELKFNKVIEKIDNKKIEKIELSIRSSQSRNCITIRLHLWSDRYVWIDARKSKKEGWEWEYTIKGRLSGYITERKLMDALKSFNKTSMIYSKETVEKQASMHWAELIATGPKEVSNA